jgi:hypothetical protein
MDRERPDTGIGSTREIIQSPDAIKYMYLYDLKL